ncbi:MAG: acyltransferase family protein [Limisphaerales bacterium]
MPEPTVTLNLKTPSSRVAVEPPVHERSPAPVESGRSRPAREPADDPHRRFRSTRYFGSLDGLRCLSILAVIWYHSGYYPASVGGLAGRGYLGVQLFFVISGFLITTLLLRERDATGRISLKHFYVRRVLRIFPLYYTIVLVYTLLAFLVERHSPVGQLFFAHLKYYLTFTQNWFVNLGDQRVIFYFAWSLATEEQFYLVWPSIEKFLRGRGPVLAASGLIVLSATIAFGGLGTWAPPGSLARKAAGGISISICLGVLLAHGLHHRETFRRGWNCFGPRWSALGALVMLGSFACGPGPLSAGAELGVYAAMAWLVGSCVVREDHFLEPILASPPIKTIGVVSYGMYLMHMLAANVVGAGLAKAGLASHGVKFVVMAGVSFGVAWLSYQFYERRFLDLKQRFLTGSRP